MTSYIGNYHTKQVFPENTREDLVPDPGTNKVDYTLGQEVPGGFEHNILLVINNVIQDPDTGSYTIGGSGVDFNKILTLNEVLQSTDVAYVLHRGSATYNLAPTARSVTPESLSLNLRNFVKDAFVGDGTTTEFTLTQPAVTSQSILVTVDGLVVDNDDLNLGVNGDYRIAGEIRLRVQNPAPGTFTVDEIVEGQTSGATARFVSQGSNELTLISLDGIFEAGEDIEGQTSLVTETLQTLDFITEDPKTLLQFISAPAGSADIRVLHLGFSTVSRRSNLSEIGVPPGGVGTTELENGSVTNPKLATNAVTRDKILNDEVGGLKILLKKDQSLRIEKQDLSIRNIVKLNLSDDLVLDSPTNSLTVQIQTTDTLEFTDQEIQPIVGTYNLGSPTNKFTDIHLSGDITLDAGQLVDGEDVSDLGSRLTTAETAIANNTPSGGIIMYGGATTPTGWLLCDGAAVSRTTYATLFSKIGTTFGAGDGSTTFNLPNFKQRFPVGNNSPSAPTLGTSGGTWSHTHTFTHTHNTSASGSLPTHQHTVGTYAGTSSHSHTVPTHRHQFIHQHNIPRHRHSSGTLSATSTNSAHRHFLNATSGAGQSFSPVNTGEIARAVGGNGADMFTGSPGLPGNSSDDGAHTHVITGEAGLSGSNLDLSGDVYSTLQTSNFTDFDGPGSTNVTNAAVTLSGSSGDNTAETVNVTGTTTSQSSSTTSTANPPYLAVNFIIKT